MLPFLLTVGERIVPAVRDLDSVTRDRVSGIIAQALSTRPAAVRRQLAIFLGVLRWAPLARYGRPFDRLAPAQQDRVLRWFHDAPIAPLRQGFWGVKTLVFMGYYGRPEVGEQIGYRPSRAGNAFLHAR